MKLHSGLVSTLLVALLGAQPGNAASVADWPEFRGPTGQGLSETATPPIEWGPEKNIAWKSDLPGTGWSSPVIYEGAIYLTSAVEDENGALASLRVLRLDAKSGGTVWDSEVFSQLGRAKKHPKNGHASPTPIVSDNRIYVHFGPLGTACLDTDGDVLWRQQGLPYKTPHGSGGSPVLHDGKLIYSCDASDSPFLVALDADTGKVAWKQPRETNAGKTFSFSTPLIIEDKGRALAVSPGSGLVGAYDVNDGEEVWRVLYGEGFSVVPRPVMAHGMVYVATGFGRPLLYAIRMGGRGDVSNSHVVWTDKEGAPNTPSMLVVGEELYAVDDRGTFSCLDARTGHVHWREDVGGKFSSSLVFADDRVYATNEDGTTLVVQRGREFRKLAENALEERVYASPALSGAALFIRSESSLYRIEAP